MADLVLVTLHTHSNINTFEYTRFCDGVFYFLSVDFSPPAGVQTA